VYAPAGVPELPVLLEVFVACPALLQATSKKQAPRTMNIRQKLRSFVALGFLNPAPPSKIAGIIRPKAKKPFESAGESSFAWDPAAVTVRVDDPALFATVIDPSEHVGAGAVAGEMLQVSATWDGFNPPDGVILMVEVADAPGATDKDTDEGERVNPGAATARLNMAEVLAR
jgi:hypothetical protein